MNTKPKKTKKLKTCKWTTADNWYYKPGCCTTKTWHRYERFDFTFCPHCGKRIE